MNRAVMTALSAILLAQGLKVPSSFVEKGHWEWKKFLGSGGMPSSHSSGVTALATYIGMKEGWDSSDFAVASLLGLIVMYDATGIRRHAGETAIQVNDLDADVEELAGDHPSVYHIRRQKKLKEALGHQPIEVIGGAILGVGVGIISHALSNQKLKRASDPHWLDKIIDTINNL